MAAIVEPFEMRKNNFSKWFFFGFMLLSMLAFAISINKAGNDKWISLGGVAMFGAVFLLNNSHKLLIDQQGLMIKEAWKTRLVLWHDITTLSYETAYHIHGMQYLLKIGHKTAAPINLHIKQYNKKQAQRLFEIMDEQTPLAIKNNWFKKMAAGELDWKSKWRML